MYLHYICTGKKIKQKGTKSFPSFFLMNIDTQARTIEGMVEKALGTDGNYFLVEVKISPTHNVKVFLDGDSGISIEKCVAINRELYKQIEERDLFPSGDFSLEVSSPGLDEPLKLLRQYRKNVGRKVEIVLKDGIRVEGKLTKVEDNAILLEEIKGKNKKQEIIQHELPFSAIKSTKIQIVF